jgi:biopolymer transport protein ExbB
MMKSVVKFFPCLSLFGLVLFASAAWTSAQEGAMLSPKDLKKRLHALDAELGTEATALKRIQGVWVQELKERKAKRRKDASSLLTLQLRYEGLLFERKSLEAAKKGHQSEAQEVSAALDRVLDGGYVQGEQIKFYLQELPGSDRAMTIVNKALADMKGKSSKDHRAELGILLGLFDSLHTNATEVKLTKTKIYTVEGEAEEVQLLSVGAVSFAYHSLDGARIGLALGSPAEASGYRWVEQLTPELRTQMQASFAGLATGKAGQVVGIPLDVSRRLRVDALLDKKDLIEQLKTGGWVMVPLGLIALLALLLIIERQIVFMFQGGSALKDIQACFQLCQERRWDDATLSLQKSRGLVSRVLLRCLESRSGGQEAMENVIQEQLLYEMPKLQKHLGGISVLGAVAPLLGLLGTVTGIIQTFGVIKVFGNANPGLMAGGISEALITTASGLVIAIPILLLHSALNGRMDRLVSDAEKYAATLLNVIAQTPPSAPGLDSAPEHSVSETAPVVQASNPKTERVPKTREAADGSPQPNPEKTGVGETRRGAESGKRVLMEDSV